MELLQLAVMIEEEIHDVENEGAKPLLDPEMPLFSFPKIENEHPLFSELEPGDA